MASKQGSAIVGALIIAVLTGAIGAAVFSSSFSEMKMSRRYVELQHAVTLAEAGLEEGVRALKNGDWTGWSAHGLFGRYRTLSGSAQGVYAGNGRTGEIKIYVHENPTAPAIAAEASIINSATGSVITRQIRVDMSAGSLFDNGLVSRNGTTFKGGNVLIDSYDSRLGGYTDTSYANRFANGTVATLSVTNDAIDVGNGHVRGFVATAGGVPDFGSNGTLHDYEGGPYPSKYKDWSRVTTDFYADLPTIEAPDTTGFTNYGSISSSDSLGGAGHQGYIVDSISLSGGSTLTIAGDVTLIVTGDVSITGNGMVEIDSAGQLEMYFDGNLKIAGNGMANNTNQAQKALLFGMHDVDGAKSIELGGNAALYAAVYAPAYNFDVHGGGSNGELFGAVVGYEIMMNGGTNFHYDEALSALATSDNYTISSWRELKGVGEQLPFDNPSDLLSRF